MALDLNDLNITPRDGAYVYMPNTPQPHNCIVSDSVTDEAPLKAGDIVTLDNTSTNPYCPVVKKAAVADAIFGVIPTDAIKDTYTAKQKVMVAIEGSYIYKTAAAAINQGVDLYFNANMQVTSTATAGNSILGTANTAAAAANDLVQVKLKFAKAQAAGG